MIISKKNIELAVRHLKSKGISKGEIAEKLSITPSHLSRIISGSVSLTDNLIYALNKSYGNELEDLNTDTDLKLVNREVSVLSEPDKNYLQHRQDLKNNAQWEGIPMFDVPFTASFAEVYRDEKIYKPRYYLYDERFRDCDFGTVIRGDSMHSEIRHGDLVVCKEIIDFGFVSYGEIYLIITSNGFETCKYLHPGKKENELILKAYNKAVPDTPLPINYLLKLYKVRGIIRAY